MSKYKKRIEQTLEDFERRINDISSRILPLPAKTARKAKEERPIIPLRFVLDLIGKKVVKTTRYYESVYQEGPYYEVKDVGIREDEIHLLVVPCEGNGERWLPYKDYKPVVEIEEIGDGDE